MSDVTPADESQRAKALVDVGRIMAAGSLTIGSIMLTVFGFVERSIGFERLASDKRLAIVALLPGVAAFAFLVCARSIGSIYDTLVPARPYSVIRRAGLRAMDLAGAYGLFAAIISALVAVSTGLAVALYLPDIGRDAMLAASAAAIASFFIALLGMLTRGTRFRLICDASMVAVIVVVMMLDWVS
ncbi:hypothetical protein E8L99_10510 [Phreatobacter aquaticus]|uniref:Uncharacterized protein n=1 Tax=Phreatobacter aquaticus TaxID=2570229 RepID=A0A4D7QPU9_9HYPH|nr:hypothetical protein [Phreatobacter aquaticus]QCK86152.1 hypothetical protein E8L99_10510 [Phreatobacter aquaticus]